MIEFDLNDFLKKSEHNKKRFGDTYAITKKYGSGYFWNYQEQDGYCLSIHKIRFAADIMLSYPLPDLYSLVFYITGSGEEFFPYQNLSPNTLRYYEPGEEYKAVYHPQVELYTVSVEFSSHFVETYLQEKFTDLDIDFRDFFRTKKCLYLPKINRLLYDLADYDEDYATARLYCESKIYEVLSLMIYYAAEQAADVPHSDSVRPRDEEAIQEVTQYMKDHYNFNLTLALLSKIACMSESKLKKVFKQYHNLSIREYIQKERMNVAEHLLISTTLPIKEISKIAGYSNPSRFTELFKRYYGFNPSKYR